MKDVVITKVIARKEKFKFEDGNEVDSFKLTAVINGASVVLSPSKSCKDLLKFVVGADAMEYDKDYVIYGAK